MLFALGREALCSDAPPRIGARQRPFLMNDLACLSWSPIQRLMDVSVKLRGNAIPPAAKNAVLQIIPAVLNQQAEHSWALALRAFQF
jgi:hypothetical protein